MNEQQKYEVIKNLVGNNGNKNKASIKLGISLRLVRKYKENDKSSFIHGNRSKPPARKNTNHSLIRVCIFIGKNTLIATSIILKIC